MIHAAVLTWNQSQLMLKALFLLHFLPLCLGSWMPVKCLILHMLFDMCLCVGPSEYIRNAVTFVIQTMASTKPLRALIISQVTALSYVSEAGVLPKKGDFFFSESKFSFHTSTLLDGIVVLRYFQSNVKTRSVTNKKRLKLQTASCPMFSCFVADCWGSCYTVRSSRNWKARSYFIAHSNSRGFV